MARSSPIQTSFLGGEWSKLAQGRSDLPAYHTALNNSTNSIPVEEGALTRRPGKQRLFPTHKRLPARLLDFEGSDTCAFILEVTTDASSGWTRFISGTLPVFTNDPRTVTAASYSGTALSLTLDTNSAWSVNDDVMLNVDGIGVTLESGCRGRIMRITAAATNTLTLADDQGNALILPPLPTGGLIGATVLRIERVSTPWLASLDKLRLVQADDAGLSVGVVLSALQPPQTVEVVEATGSDDPVFTIAATAFVDGPYADAQPDTGTVSAYTGSITFTPASSTFVAADVGRHIRLFSEPPAWASGTTYSNGALVTYAGAYWVATNAGAYSGNNTGVIPGTNFLAASGASVALWAPAPTAAVWAWGKITAQAGSSCTVALQTNLPSANGSTISIWQLGLYFAGQYPTCGVFHEGRLILAGAVNNRFDASMSNDIFTFSPSDVNGVVNDDHAISYTLNAKKRQSILWLIPDDRGIIVGALGGEWLISATTANDILTPTSIQAHQVTDFKCFNAEPVRAGMAIVFIQRYGQRVYEYLADAFTNRFTGKHLNEFAKHLSEEGVAEVAYQEERAPIVWARTNSNRLIGCTYRRTSRFVTENPVFNAWHPHDAGGDFTTTSICAISSETLLDDRLFLVCAQPNGAVTDYFVEMLRPLPLADDDTLDAWYCDSAPGNQQSGSILKCGARLASLGPSVPAPFVITAPSGPPALIDRATITPGTNPVLSDDAATRKKQLGFDITSPGLMPYFDANTILYDLGMPTSNSGSFSFSGWIFPDNMAEGALIRSPVVARIPNTVSYLYIGAPGLGASFSGGITPDAGSSDWPSSRTSVALVGMSPTAPGKEQHYYLYNSHISGNFGNSFYHLMIGIQAVGGVAQITVYINDTAICSNLAMDTNGSNGSPSDYSILYSSLRDGAAPAGTATLGPDPTPKLTGSNRWVLGAGAYRDSGSGSTEDVDTAIQCVASEWWIAAGHYVDWTNSANRNKFHTLDSTLSRYVPVNLGAKGQAAGFNPTIYCTGGPAAFRINRVTGKLLTMLGGSGDVTFVPHYGEVENMVSDDRVPGR